MNTAILLVNELIDTEGTNYQAKPPSQLSQNLFNFVDMEGMIIKQTESQLPT